MGGARAVAGMNPTADSRAAVASREPLSLLIAALGGQGGGVLTDWVVQAAHADGYKAQATSTPGVSQRTGATTYYVEIVTGTDAAARTAALALMPLPGRVDVVVCAELLEAARMLERGVVTPARTTVIASTHRVYTTREKMERDDGRFDAERIVAAVRSLARRAVLVDMEAVRARHGAAISAVLFGALAGSGALPLSRVACEDAIRAAGKGVAASIAAFGDAYARAESPDGVPSDGPGGSTAPPAADDVPLPMALARRVAALPPLVCEYARPGARRTLDYQNDRYAQRYLDRVERIVRAQAAAGRSPPPAEVAREAARYLALWMCYDDLIRVASRKARQSRLARIRREVAAQADDVVRIYDVFRPGVQEIAAILPRRIGAWLAQRERGDAPALSVGSGLRLQASSVAGALVLRFASALRPLRPHSLRFVQEQAAIDDWLGVLEGMLAADGRDSSAAGLEVARLPRLIKGYGDTQARGREEFNQLLDAGRDGNAAGFLRAQRARRDAVASDCGSWHGAAQARSPRAQPVLWAKRPPA